MQDPTSSGAAGALPVSRGAGPTRGQRYALGLLTLVYVSNYLDRQILSVLLPAIKESFGASDTQLGFLSGISFALFYATLGIPIALWADRGNRRNIIALGLTLFSLFTLLCGLAQSFVQLVFARIGVGVGEAGTSPPSHSIIADLYPPERRATAMGIFALGVNAGILIGFLVGGWMNEFYGWRVTFMLVGAPGLILALVVRFTLSEPARGQSEGRVQEANDVAPSVASTFALFWRRRSLRYIGLGAALNAFVGYGAVFWVPSFLHRSYEMSSGEIGTWLAFLFGAVGGLGTFLGGYYADRLGARDVRWKLWLVAACVAGGLPFSVLVYLAPTSTIALLAFIVPAMVGAIYLGPSIALVQGLVPLRARTTASAILLFVINIIGLGLGPQAIGLLSDLLAPSYGQESLRYALLFAGVANLGSAFYFVLAARSLSEDLAEAGRSA